MPCLQPEAAKYLWDASRAAERITRFTAGETLQSYVQDDMLRSAVERQFEIIGEALGQLRKAFPEVAAQVPDLPRIVAFRNVLIHGYASIDDQLVWGMVVAYVPSLARQLQSLLAED
ncbi:MAG: DUF86 domain-containing protein [Aquabacterium sp.]|jgi:uncharacterized protein with HEPN domain|nr:DUF86 domain-containing protein [Aquabacterium sp.]